MDKSKKYIKMCFEAKEIQKLWKPQEGDFYAYEDAICDRPVYCVETRSLNHPKDDDFCTFCNSQFDGFNDAMCQHQAFFKGKSKTYDMLSGLNVWLPRQDQLQEMGWKGMVDIGNTNRSLHRIFSKHITENFDRLKKLKSMEQLWLSFLMYSKFTKTWESKEWRVLKPEEIK